MKFWFWRLIRKGGKKILIGIKEIPVKMSFKIKGNGQEISFSFSPQIGEIYAQCNSCHTLTHITDSCEKEAEKLYKMIFPEKKDEKTTVWEGGQKLLLIIK